MTVTKRNLMVPVDMIEPHPDNPRKDVGDVTELAESIKKNGIFQNLTILRDKDPETGKHTVIIGHRRLAAAKLAGLKEVPCMVVEMDKKEQIATMLLENMQRSDLTIYEQAQGFQMMLDLGETKSEIAEKTGFSETTVRHRLKLLELDPEEFRKAEERQPKLTDYIELEKLNDPELKSKALKTIGTSNFQWTMESCKRQQREKTIREEWLTYIDKLFVKTDWDPEREVVKTIYFTKKMTDEDKAELDKFQDEDNDNVLDYWHKEGNTYCYILGKKRDKPLPKYEEEQRKRTEKIDRIRTIQNQAQALRQKFVKEYVSKSNHRAMVLRALFSHEIDICDVKWNRVAEVLGIPCGEDEDFDSDTITENSDFIMLCVTSPDKVLLTVIADYVEDNDKRVYAWDGSYNRNEGLERWYRTLESIGYSISDEERQMLDGTHECFKEET
jgi:ParB family chromosome partitioning protein